MFISVTAFRPEGILAKLAFQMHAVASFIQANKAPGLIKAENFSPEKGIRCTLTHWKSQEDMLNYRNNGAHLKAMKKSGKLGKGIATGWEDEVFWSKESAIEKLWSLKGRLNSDYEKDLRLG